MLNADPTIVRILAVVLGVVTAIIPALIVYVVLIFVIPSDLDRPPGGP
jgi:phage shock protein PspC (stress-responsive transcriptional regulator)